MKRNYAYAVVYDRTGRFLVADKLPFGFFFFENGKGKICNPGVSLHGGGYPALPGGERKKGEDNTAAAKREFLEETGVSIPAAEQVSGSPTWTDTKTGNQYAAGYFQVRGAVLQNLLVEVAAHLAAGEDAAIAVMGEEVKDYSSLRTEFPAAPDSNELENPAILSVQENWDAIQGWGGSTDWFKTILGHMKKGLNFTGE